LNNDLQRSRRIFEIAHRIFTDFTIRAEVHIGSVPAQDLYDFQHPLFSCCRQRVVAEDVWLIDVGPGFQEDPLRPESGISGWCCTDESNET